ncbi:MAG: adenylate/guanylate cyclase domain-containing protein [Clostridiales bacterium]|nr:adenylate/guanylate cyclase domain-containing protein [Clostridiales bacterium]
MKKKKDIKPLAFLKKVICKTCGKARWLVLLYVFLLVLSNLLSIIPYTERYCSPYMNDEWNTPDIVPLERVVEFGINDEGNAIFFLDNGIGEDKLCAILDIDNGVQSYANASQHLTDSDGEEIRVYNFAVTDDNVIYAVTYDTTDSTFITEERIIRLSADYRYLGDVCKIEYPVSSSGSRLSRLHYYDGKITFAVVDLDGVTLYSIDTNTSGITISDKYMNDSNGTYTSSVIPIDGGFLFLRSDGNVYRTSFGEPLEDIIYTFDISSEGQSENPYFAQATLLNGTLYAVDQNEPTKVFAIEDGEIHEVFDIGGDSVIRYMDTYVDETGEAVLVVCCDNSLQVYKNGTLTNKNIVIKPERYIAIYVLSVLNYVRFILIIGLLINLIIRKKTLLFKQIAVTIPILVAMIFVIAFNLYSYFIRLNNENIEKEVAIIAELGCEELDGYDFSGLLTVDENTGEAYHELGDRLMSLTRDRLSILKDDFYFSVIYQKPDGKEVVLGRSDRIVQPMYSVSDLNYVNGDQTAGDAYIVNDINSFWFDNDSRTSSINAVKRINDKDGSGNFYFVVTTENKGFWIIRRDFVVSEFMYGSLIFVIMTFIVTMSTIGITRSIRKARKTVEKISEGDLTARVNYRSNDELGEICTKVNEMGQSLETLFNEKDKAESFYYKFVPQKFKEYLGKENIAELSLGDASSRDLTVLFCDIRSFSINSEIMTAKENFAFVNTVYGKAGPVIRENNGFIDKYIGDAIMALFESADDAVKAGNEIYKAIVLDPTTADELNVSSINIGIGLHSGMAMVGIVGESERLSGTVISDTVNLSSRLESLTKQFKTAMLISKDTLDRMEDTEAVNLRYLGMIQVAGVNEVKSVYEVLDCLPEEERQKRSANADDFKEAIRLFHLGRRDEACAMLQKIADDGRNDYVSDMYLKYITELSDEDKANVFRFVRK